MILLQAQQNGPHIKKETEHVTFCNYSIAQVHSTYCFIGTIEGGRRKKQKTRTINPVRLCFRTRRYVPNEPSTGNDAISLIERRVTFGRYYKLNRATLWRWVYVTMSTTNTNIEENRINLSVVMNMTSLLYSTNEIEILKEPSSFP